MALRQTRLTSVLLPFLDRPVYRLRTPRYTPRPFFPPCHGVSFHEPANGTLAYFHPSNRTCDEAPVIVTKKPILSLILSPYSEFPLSQSRVTTLETRDPLSMPRRDILRSLRSPTV